MIFGKHINKYYLRYLHYFLLGIITLVAIDYVQLLIPEYQGIIVDHLDNQSLDLGYLSELMINMLWIALTMFIGRFLWRICFFGTAIKVEADLREKLFCHSELLSQDYYHHHKVGAQMALYTNDLMAIRHAFGSGALMLFDALILGGIAFYKMINLHLGLTLISALPLLLMAVFGGIVGKYMTAKYRDRQKAYEELSEFTQENFSGLSVIRAFVQETKELLAFHKINKNNEEKNISFLKYSVLLNIVLVIFINLIGFIMIGYGSYLIITTKHDGGFTIGNLTQFIAYFGSMIWPMIAIAQLITLRSQGKASYKRIEKLLEYPVEIKDDNVYNDLVLDGAIEFRDFSFSHPGSDQQALSNINLQIAKGESIGIIGRTGCGKTTLVDCLLRIYNLNENSLFIDGIDIMRLPFKQVRDLIGYVPQDNFLFSDTIHHNIAFAHDELEEEKVAHYAHLASVSDNIEEFPAQYQTILGERGVTISGGQKQRISIARALAKEPKILILDDSISAVDSKTEVDILSNLDEFKQTRTIILIAHRISSIKDFDKIVLMDQGKIVASGKHEELLKECVLYQEMVKLQSLEEKVQKIGGSINA